MMELEREQLRDQAALSALRGILAEGDCDPMKLAADAYSIADAILAARDLPSQFEKFADAYKREAAKREKERAESEAHSRTLEPLFEWVAGHFNGCYDELFAFSGSHKPDKGGNIVEEFKEWLKTNKGICPE